MAHPYPGTGRSGPKKAASLLSFLSSGTDGMLIDFTNAAKVFSDAAGTTPATLTGPIQCVKDQTPFGHNFTQAGTVDAPAWKQDGGGNKYADWVGAGNYMTAGNVMNVGTGNFYYTALAQFGPNTIEFLMGKTWLAAGNSRIHINTDTGVLYFTIVTAAGVVRQASVAFVSTALHVFTFLLDRTAAKMSLRIDAVEVAAFNALPDPGNLVSGNNYPFDLGAFRDTTPAVVAADTFTGNMYCIGGKIIPAATPVDLVEVHKVETFIGAKGGLVV